tara:strand:- start:328 stop:582 length:255 start_codon:yes stop_codon:yes gene_type:complete
MTKKTREELIREYAEFTASRMTGDSLKRIAVITLVANIDPNSTREDWEDYVARIDPLMTSEDLLQMIQPHVIMTKPVKARPADE